MAIWKKLFHRYSVYFTGVMLENAVAIDLYRRYGPLSYWKDNKGEVDFVTPSYSVQVSYELGENLERELKSLERYMEKYGIKKGYIVNRFLDKKLTDQIEAISIKRFLLR